MTIPGRLLTLEGVDGAGKSTHVDWLVDTLRSYGLAVMMTREPGGTLLGERLRDLVLNQPMGLCAETLLVFAARSEHLDQVIEPALKRGVWVVCDRFTDATYAYQGGGRQLGTARIAILEQWVHAHRQPDLTWLFDVPLEVARTRLQQTRALDRFESEDSAFFQRVRETYLARAQAYPDRIHIVDGRNTIADIRLQLQAEIQKLVATASSRQKKKKRSGYQLESTSSTSAVSTPSRTPAR